VSACCGDEYGFLRISKYSPFYPGTQSTASKRKEREHPLLRATEILDAANHVLQHQSGRDGLPEVHQVPIQALSKIGSHCIRSRLDY